MGEWTELYSEEFLLCTKYHYVKEIKDDKMGQTRNTHNILDVKDEVKTELRVFECKLQKSECWIRLTL
jgi:hypothetical protein